MFSGKPLSYCIYYWYHITFKIGNSYNFPIHKINEDDSSMAYVGMLESCFAWLL